MAQFMRVLPILIVAAVLFVAVCYIALSPERQRVRPSSLNTVDINRPVGAGVKSAAHSSDALYVRPSRDLYDKVKVLCWILTMPTNHLTKAKAVKETWAPRCNKAIFMSSSVEPSIPTIDLKLSGEGRDKLWEKSRKAWYYVFQHFADDYDWFMKADDDSFVIPENLRYLCSHYDPNQGHYFGRVFKPFMGYASGGAGYVISRAALQKVGPLLAEDGKCGSGIWTVEDAKFGGCMKDIGVSIGDSRDKEADRFHPFVPEQHLIPGVIPAKFWYRDYVKYPTKEGPECCSDLSISFHYMTPNLMHQMYFFVYKLHPYGAWERDDQLPPPHFVRPSADGNAEKPEQKASETRTDQAAKLSTAVSEPKEQSAPKQSAAEANKDQVSNTVKIGNDGRPIS